MSKRHRAGKRAAAPARRSSIPRRSALRSYGFLFIAALALRLLYVLSIRHTYFFDHLQTEPLRYQRWASLIVEGRAPLPPYDEAPAYPFFVAAMDALFGRSLLPIAIVQAVLDA